MKKSISFIICLVPITLFAASNTANKDLEHAIFSNNAAGITRALSGGADNAAEILASMSKDKNTLFKTFKFLSEQSKQHISAGDLADVGKFCKSGGEIWPNVISDIRIEYNMNESVYAFVPVVSKDGVPVGYKSEKVASAYDLSEQEKFIWYSKPCNRLDLADNESFMNCQFEMLEKYCNFAQIKELYASAIIDAQKEAENRYKEEKKNQSIFHDAFYPDRKLTVQTSNSQIMIRKRLGKINALIKQAEQSEAK